VGSLHLGIALPIGGRVILTATDPATGRIVDRIESNNLIVTAGKNLCAMMLGEQSGYNTGLTYCALGTNNATPTVADTTLGTEAARKAVTTYSISGGELTCSTFFLSTEANIAIKEIGLFGHSTAGPGVNSGILFNHALLSYDNSGGSPLDLTVDVIITFG